MPDKDCLIESRAFAISLIKADPAPLATYTKTVFLIQRQNKFTVFLKSIDILHAIRLVICMSFYCMNIMCIE